MKNLFIFILISNLLFFFLLFYKDAQQWLDSSKSVRKSLLYAILLIALFIQIFTEIFSLFNVLNFYALLICWTCSLLVSGYFLIKDKCYTFPTINISKAGKIPFVLIALFLLWLLILGILQAPNNWDSMTYHLARVMHWIQNQSVSYYASHIERQVVFTTLSEYCILHTILLTGNDYFANSVQWLSFLASLVCISLIVEQLGGSQKTAFVAVFLFMAIPMSMFQAVSTQNDLLASSFILAAYYFFLQWKQNFHKFSVLGLGISVALATLTKSTSYFFLAPLVVAVFLVIVKKTKMNIFLQGVSMALIIIFLNSFYFARNLVAFKTIIPQTEATINVRNEVLNLPFFLSNNIKTFGFNFITNNVEIDRVVENTIYGVNRVLSINPNDKRVSFGNFELPFGIKFYSHDYAPQTLHAWLLLLTFPFYFIFRERFSNSFFYTSLMIFIGFELMILLLKWQPFGTRFQIPFWSWVSVWLSFLFEIKIAKQEKISNLVFYLLILALSSISYYYTYQCINISLKTERNIFNTDREYLYFIHRSDLYEAYQSLVRQIQKSSCKKISLSIQLDSWEYPLWRMLKNRNIDIYLKHKDVQNATNIFEKEEEFCGRLEIDNTKGIALYHSQ